jgi:hypothetical protein
MEEMDTESQCDHSAEERSFVGTFCSPELQKAISKGYTVLKTYEVWEFQLQVGLFEEYVKSFLTMKQEASGFPPDCVTDQDKQRYINQYEKHEGISLDYNNIQDNPGLRYISKLFLNSLYGKWGQRTDLPQTKVVSDAMSFLELVRSPHLEIHGVVGVGDSKLIVSYKDLENENTPRPFTNVAIAAFISSWARVRLYELLETVGGDRVIYCDTDSVIYVENRNQVPVLSTGNFLGELTNEIPQGWEMFMFIGLGPKNYAYRIKNLNTGEMQDIIKIRGITLNYRTRLIIDFDHFYNLVRHKYESKLIFSPNNICRRQGYVIISKGEYKTHQEVNNKRRKLNPSKKDDYQTLLYGYKQT